MTIGIDPRVDFACKLLLGSPDHPAITIHFLNAVLGSQPKIAEVQILNPIVGKKYDNDKFSILDILATDDHGRFIDIEVQTTLPAGLSKRLTYYAGSQLVEQLGDGDSYRDLRPSIGICILDAILFGDSARIHLDFQLRSAGGERLTDCLQIHLLELPKYQPVEDNVVPPGPISQWVHFFRFAASSTAEGLYRLLPDPVFTEAIGVLEMIAQNPAEKRYYESRLRMQRDEQARLEATEERGHEQGVEQGEAIGRVRVLQSLAGVEESSVEQLRSKSLHELAAMEDSLSNSFEVVTDLAIGGHQEVMTYCHRNQQYSVTALTNGSGTITERYSYTAYGQPAFFDGSGTTITSSAEDNRYTYTGREWDEDLHLYHYRARMYDAVAGRFVSRDPIGYVDANSLYLFVLSAPLANLDPFGEKTNDCRRSHDECCADYLNANPDVTKDGVLGKVVCCDGRPVPCVFLGIDTDPRDNETPKLDKATELIAECIKKHEENHILHYPGGCDDNAKGNLYPRFRPREEKDRSECLAYKRSLRCLKSAYRRCQKLPQCNSDDIDRHLRDNRERVAYHCSRARIEF